MSKKSLIDSLEIINSCSEDWNEMKGSETARFCSHCAKNVNNLSALTRKQAMRLMREAKGEICVRYIKNPRTNRPVFAGQLYQITRRAGFAAAGVLGASLTLSTMAYAQGSWRLREEKPTETTQTEVLEKKRTENDETIKITGTVSGTITDPNGVVIPNVSVTVSGEKYIMTAMTDENGFYKFKDVPPGMYKIVAAGVVGFKTASTDVPVTLDRESVADIQVEVDATMMAVVVGGAEIIEFSNPLAVAVSADDLDEVKNLIAKGENVNSRDENYDRITPLFIAVENGSAEITETLLGFGAKVNARSRSDRQTPLMRLDEDTTAELVRTLLKYGAKVNLADNESNTALILAAAGNDKPEVLQLLIESGSDLNAQNKQGRTALMNAADADNLENVKILLAAGAKINLKDKEGETALNLTSSTEIEDLLENYGAIIDEN